MKPKSRPFFLGYGKRLPKDVAKLVLPAFALFLISFVALSLLLSSSQGDPGEGRFRGDLGRQELTGVLEFRPYPVLRLPASGSEPATTVLMSGQGKRGAVSQGDEKLSKPVTARGVYLKRGDITMLQLAGRNGLNDAEAMSGFKPTQPEQLGKWRLAGEICDGKCYTGAMRPGTGLAHKACANLCISGGVPAVFVSSGAVEGSKFFLLADMNGNPLGEELYDLVALRIEAEGAVERLDDLMVFKMDVGSIKVLK